MMKYVNASVRPCLASGDVKLEGMTLAVLLQKANANDSLLGTPRVDAKRGGLDAALGGDLENAIRGAESSLTGRTERQLRQPSILKNVEALVRVWETEEAGGYVNQFLKRQGTCELVSAQS